jgi:heat shock protein HtpX
VTARAIVLLGLIVGLFVWTGSFFGLDGACIALAASIIFAFWSYWSAAPEFLARTGAFPCRNAIVLELTARVAARAGTPAPQVYLIEDAQPNALAIGPNPAQSILVLTSALCRDVSLAELEAVIAHELSHIRNRDILATTLATSFVGAVISLSLLIGIVGLSNRRHGGGAIVLIAVLAPLFAILIRLAMSRSAEYRADHDAALLCGGPQPLISVLRYLDQTAERIPSCAAMVSPAAAAVFTVNPLRKSWLGGLVSPHPPVERRIARLEAMSRPRLESKVQHGACHVVRSLYSRVNRREL